MKEPFNPIRSGQLDDPASVKGLFDQFVLQTYGRFELAFSHGQGSYLWDVTGKRYLDLGGGIAVCALGHAHPAISQTLLEQSKRLVHISNLYYHELQGRLAESLASLIGPGKCFFANSGGEANEGLYKLARRFGHEEGRFEIITAQNSFHGRSLAGIAATGQEKIKKGFGPMVPGFRHVAFNDLDAIRSALSPATAAILIEGIQGESGITPATPEYLLGLRRLCDEKKLLLLLDEVQAGHFRTGRFHSYSSILEDHPQRDQFLPDAVSMAKSIAGGFPLGAIWVAEAYAGLLGPGSHATTFGGNPLACAVALKVLEVIQEEHLDQNARNLGEHFVHELLDLAKKYPGIIREVRGVGLMIGFELAPDIPALEQTHAPPALQFVQRLHADGLLAIPAGTHVIRLLPALNLTRTEAGEGLNIIANILSQLVP